MRAKASLTLLLLTIFSLMTTAQDKHLVIHVHFESPVPQDIEVVPAILKYNKEFAFSFTFDDGLDDAYSLGFKLLGGGYSEVDRITFPGLFSSDGCGNRIPFRAGIAWFTANKYGMDLHDGSPGYMTYVQAIEIYKSGWDFYNHSYNHGSFPDIIDYAWQLDANAQALKRKTGIDLFYCVPPAGDTSYILPAFSLGAHACFTSSARYAGSMEAIDVTLPVASTNPVYWRNVISSSDDDPAALKLAIDNLVATSGQGKQKWVNEFTHRVSYNFTGSSVLFPDFREYFEHMEKTFGIRGKDNGWFASSSEVFEYLMVRDKIVIQQHKTGNLLDVTLDFSKVPENFRYHDLSLLIRGSAIVASVSGGSPGKVTHGPSIHGHLVNIGMPNPRFIGYNPGSPGTIPQVLCFPNPVTGKSYLRIPGDMDNIEIRISNILAGSHQLRAIDMGDGLFEMDFDSGNYPPGLYVIQVYATGKFIGSSKIIIE